MSAWREALPTRTRTQNGKAYELLVSIFGDAVREGKITGLTRHPSRRRYA